jgi:hypothetical protein
VATAHLAVLLCLRTGFNVCLSIEVVYLKHTSANTNRPVRIESRPRQTLSTLPPQSDTFFLPWSLSSKKGETWSLATCSQDSFLDPG